MMRTFAIGSFLALAAAAAAAPQTTAPPQAVPAAAVEAPAPVAGSGMAALEALPPQGYTYNAERRRDPFVVLLKRGSDTAVTSVAARAAGLAGLNTGEVTLRGVLVSHGEYVAMLLGSDDKTYIVRSGDTLADGTIRAITADALIVLQHANDPLSTQEQREVRKRLRRTDETR
jgi:Tfp pilus assembly protein PilP